MNSTRAQTAEGRDRDKINTDFLQTKQVESPSVLNPKDIINPHLMYLKELENKDEETFDPVHFAVYSIKASKASLIQPSYKKFRRAVSFFNLKTPTYLEKAYQIFYSLKDEPSLHYEAHINMGSCRM